MPAARAVWIERHGPIPKGKHVLHTCNRGGLGCIGISHLYLGTDVENGKDRVSDGVHRGQGATQLTAALAVEIRSQFTGKKGEVTRLAQKYGVSFDAIWNLKRGSAWGWAK